MINYLTKDKRVWEIENFLSKEELSIFDDHIKTTKWVTQEKWENPVFFNNTSIFSNTQFIADRANVATNYEYEWKSFGIIMRIQPGYDMNSHVDNYNNFDNSGENNFMSAHIYLNDDFQGGELCYENLNIDYKPKRGSIVFHPGFEEIYRHKVKTVIGSDRYAIGLVGKSLT